MKRRRRKKAVTLVALGAVVAAGVALAIVAVAFVYLRSPPESGRATVGSLSKIWLVHVGPLGPDRAGEIVAEQAELFARAGLDVGLKSVAAAEDPVASVVNGTATIGLTDSVSFLIARSKSQPIVAFAAGYLESAIVFYALEKSGIRSPRDFVGKRAGRPAGTSAAIFYDALLKNVGLSRSNIRESGAETDIAALLNGKVDVIPGRVGTEAFILREKQIPYSVIRTSDYGIHVPDTVYFTTEKFIHDHPSVVQRFLRAVIDGWGMTYAEPSKSIPLIVRAGRGSLSPEQVEFMLAAQRDFVKPLGRRFAEFDDRQWKQLVSFLTSARLIDDSIDMSRAINYQILKEAYRKPITFGN